MSRVIIRVSDRFFLCFWPDHDSAVYDKIDNTIRYEMLF